MRLLILAASLLFYACNSATAPRIGEEFTLKQGRTVSVRGTGLSVTFLSVAEDSRCPARAECVWAGNGAVAVQTVLAGAARIDTLNTFLEPGVLPLDGIQLQLVALDPYPEIPLPIEQVDYSVTLTTTAVR